jgi:Na+/H+-dicarboxylate symporter
MKKNPLNWALHWQIFLALLLALIIGLGLKPLGADSDLTASILGTCSFIGSLFMNALKMVIVPLIVASIICGVMHLGKEQGVGRIGFKTLLYYTLSGAVAVLIGLLVVNVIGPGNVDPETAAAMLGQGADATAAAGLDQRVAGRDGSDLAEIFLRMFPPNIVDAATSNGQLLGVIVFSLLFGLFIGRLTEDLRATQASFWEGVQSVMLMLTEAIIRFAPLGVLGLVTPVIYEAPLDQLFGAILAFFVTVVLALALHAFVVLAIALKWGAGISPGLHYRSMAPVLLTAFSTSSSSATLPLTMETVQQKAGVSKKLCAFTLPLGATVNMDGTALYECVVVIFIAQLYAAAGGIALGFTDQLLVVLLALTTSIGVAGIPSASLVAIAIILPVVGLPLEAIGVVWVTDRLLDMMRTSVNVFSDTVAAVVIARSEGEVPYATAPTPLNRPQ